MTSFSQIFSQRLKTLMVENGDNNTELAKKIGLNRTTITRYLSGVVSPKVPTVQVIAELYNVNPLWLSGISDTKEILEPTKTSTDLKHVMLNNLHMYSEKSSQSVDEKIETDKLKERIKSLRHHFKITLDELSEKTNISVNTLKKVEAGKSFLTSKQLYDIAETFDITIDYLVGRTEIMNLKKHELSLINALFENLIKVGAITDINNIDENIKTLILNTFINEILTHKLDKK